MEGARWLDPVGGLIISGMIVQAGCMNTKSALYELADSTMDEEAKQGAEKAVIAALADTPAEIRGVQGIKSGQNLMFEVEVGVPEDWSVSYSNDIEVQIREAISTKVRGTKRVNVRFTTSTQQPFLDQFTQQEATLEPQDHDHSHDHSHGDHVHTNGHAHTTATKTPNPIQKRKS